MYYSTQNAEVWILAFLHLYLKYFMGFYEQFVVLYTTTGSWSKVFPCFKQEKHHLAQSMWILTFLSCNPNVPVLQYTCIQLSPGAEPG